MKKHYLKLTTIISSSILSCSLVIAPLTSKASMRTIRQSHATTSGIGGNSLFRPINPAGTSCTSGKLYRPTPLKPPASKFNPVYDSDSSSVGSNSLKSISSSSSLGSAAFNSTLGSVHSNTGNTSNTNANNATTTSPQNTSNPNSSGNSRFKLKFTDLTLIGITAASLTGFGIGISQLVDKDNNKTNDNKPKLNEHVNQN